MRITLVSPFDPTPPRGSRGSERVGGVERVFAEVAAKLAARGHDVTLLCSTGGKAGSSSEGTLRIVRRPRRATILKDPFAQLSRSIATGPDIVHVAATYPFTTPSVLRRAHKLGIPSILDFHFEPVPMGAVGRLAATVYRLIGPRDYGLASAVLVRSVAYGQSSPSLDDVPVDRWRVIPNGIDPAHFRPDGPARAGNYMLFVGRLVDYKGLFVLFAALSRLRPGVQLYVAGEGPLEQQLRERARMLGIDVRFLGHVPDSDLPALYRGACLTILPSLTGQESFGIALIESMACGTPVVASRLPGVADIAAIGGLLAEPGDVASLADKIRMALEAPLPRGAALAAKVHAAYSWDAVTDRLETVYNEVVRARTIANEAKQNGWRPLGSMASARPGDGKAEATVRPTIVPTTSSTRPAASSKATATSSTAPAPSTSSTSPTSSTAPPRSASRTAPRSNSA